MLRLMCYIASKVPTNNDVPRIPEVDSNDRTTTPAVQHPTKRIIDRKPRES